MRDYSTEREGWDDNLPHLRQPKHSGAPWWEIIAIGLFITGCICVAIWAWMR